MSGAMRLGPPAGRGDRPEAGPSPSRWNGGTRAGVRRGHDRVGRWRRPGSGCSPRSYKYHRTARPCSPRTFHDPGCFFPGRRRAETLRRRRHRPGRTGHGRCAPRTPGRPWAFDVKGGQPAGRPVSSGPRLLLQDPSSSRSGCGRSTERVLQRFVHARAGVRGTRRPDRRSTSAFWPTPPTWLVAWRRAPAGNGRPARWRARRRARRAGVMLVEEEQPASAAHLRWGRRRPPWAAAGGAAGPGSRPTPGIEVAHQPRWCGGGRYDGNWDRGGAP